MCAVGGPSAACRDCGAKARDRAAIELLADPTLYGRVGTHALYARTPEDMQAPCGAWMLPVFPAPAPADGRTAVHLFAARGNVARQCVSLFNLATPALVLWQHLAHNVSGGRLPASYVINSVRMADFVLVARRAATDEGLLAPVSHTQLHGDPVVGILSDVTARGSDVAFCAGFTGKSRAGSLGALRAAMEGWDPTRPFLERHFKTTLAVTEPLRSDVTGFGAAKGFRVTHDRSQANVPEFLTAKEVGLLAHFVGDGYRALRADFIDAYANIPAEYARERETLAPFLAAVTAYIEDAVEHLRVVEALARHEPGARGAPDDLLRTVYGPGYAERPESFHARLAGLGVGSERAFAPGDRVIKLTCVVAAVGSGGAGLGILNAAKLLATRAGAWLLVESVTWPLLPFRFYFEAGFNFIAPRTLTSCVRVERWLEGTVWMAWRPAVRIKSTVKDFETGWPSRDLSMSKMEDSNAELVVDGAPGGPFLAFMERLAVVGKNKTVPVRLTRPSRSFNTIITAFDTACAAYRRRALPALCASFRCARVPDFVMNHCRLAPPAAHSMNATVALSPAETLAEAALRAFGATTICSGSGVKRSREPRESASPVEGAAAGAAGPAAPNEGTLRAREYSVGEESKSFATAPPTPRPSE